VKCKPLNYEPQDYIHYTLQDLEVLSTDRCSARGSNLGNYIIRKYESYVITSHWYYGETLEDMKGWAL
jgi:hypothetical protein